MKCAYCGHQNPPQAVLCEACDQPVSGKELSLLDMPTQPMWKLEETEPAPQTAVNPAASTAAARATPMSAARPNPVPELEIEPVYAGFWERLASHIIDNLLTTLLAFAGAMLFGIFLGVAQVRSGLVGGTGLAKLGSIAGFILGIALPWLYYALLESSDTRATLGKQLFGLAVQRSDGEQITFARASGRYLAKFISLITLLVGYLMQPFTRRKQALHDMLSDVVVVRQRERGLGRQVLMLLVLLLLPSILLAIAFPAYQTYRQRAITTAAGSDLRQAATVVSTYRYEKKIFPETLGEAGFRDTVRKHYLISFDADTGELHARFMGAGLDGKSMQFALKEGMPLNWECTASGFRPQDVPPYCMADKK